MEKVRWWKEGEKKVKKQKKGENKHKSQEKKEIPPKESERKNRTLRKLITLRPQITCPEQSKGREPLSVPADLYEKGCVTSAAQALRAAEKIGFPVMIKVGVLCVCVCVCVYVCACVCVRVCVCVCVYVYVFFAHVFVC